MDATFKVPKGKSENAVLWLKNKMEDWNEPLYGYQEVDDESKV